MTMFTPDGAIQRRHAEKSQEFSRPLRVQCRVYVIQDSVMDLDTIQAWVWLFVDFSWITVEIRTNLLVRFRGFHEVIRASITYKL